MAASGPSVALRYDPLGRLYEMIGPSGTTQFLYDGDALVGEYLNTPHTMTRRYVHGSNPGADDPLIWYDPTVLHYLHTDHQGSIVAAANNAGTVVAINAYDEYGIPAATNQGRFQYTGQIWIPELGMYHYKARILSPTLGRFLQTDPIGYEDQFNLYAYVGNDPVNSTDPTGKSCIVAGAAKESFIECRVDNVDRTRLTSRQRTQLARFERQYTRTVNRLLSLPNRTISVGPSGRAAHNGAPLGAFRITRREAAVNLIRRTFSYTPGDTTGNARDLAYTRGTAGPRGTGQVTSHLKGGGLESGDALTVVHEGALHGSRQEYGGGLVLPDGRGLGREPYRSGHQAPYERASCELLEEC